MTPLPAARSGGRGGGGRRARRAAWGAGEGAAAAGRAADAGLVAARAGARPRRSGRSWSSPGRTPWRPLARLVRDEGFAKVQAIVAGGERRQDSVARGTGGAAGGDRDRRHPRRRAPAGRAGAVRSLCALPPRRRGAAIAATPVADTLKRVAEGIIAGTVDRAGLWAAQTPQAFRLELVAAGDGRQFRGDRHRRGAAVRGCRHAGGGRARLAGQSESDPPRGYRRGRRPCCALGDGADPSSQRPSVRTRDRLRRPSLRARTPAGPRRGGDRARSGVGRALRRRRPAPRHRRRGPRRGRAGRHRPALPARPTSASATPTARICCARPSAWLREAGWAPGNVDATVLAEAPRIGPHVPLMRERIAACLGLAPDAVSVKATTNEGMGAIGRGEGIAALATATLVPVPPTRSARACAFWCSA